MHFRPSIMSPRIPETRQPDMGHYYYYYYCHQLTTATSRLRPTQLRTLLLHPNILKASLFRPSQEVPISFKSFFMTSSYPNRGRPAFRLILDSWPKRTIFSSLSSFIRKACPNHLNLSLIIVIESGIEPHFSHILLFEIRSVSQSDTQNIRVFRYRINIDTTYTSNYIWILITPKDFTI